MTFLHVKTTGHSQMVNITGDVAGVLPADFSGAVVVFCQHTTAGLTINENADPDVVHDLLGELNRLSPWKNPAFRHLEGNSSAHAKATLSGSSVTVPVVQGRMQLGTWQSIYFCEFDGPRSRRVAVTLLPGY
jgi:secondary thiamine-phosphate synthase enzyme